MGTQDLLKRWTDHFRNLLTDITTIDENVIYKIDQSPSQQTLDDCPTLVEVQQAIDMLSNGKSPGGDGIHPEILKRGGTRLVEVLLDIIQEA